MSEKKVITLDWQFPNGKVVAPMNIPVTGSGLYLDFYGLLGRLSVITGKRWIVKLEEEKVEDEA